MLDIKRKGVVPTDSIIVCPMCNKVSKFGKFETLSIEEEQILEKKKGLYDVEKKICQNCTQGGNV